MQLDPAAACEALVQDLGERFQRWDLPPERRIERIEPTFEIATVFLEGYYGDTMRLLGAVSIDADAATAEIALIATKGALSVDSVSYGDTGPLVGNTVLVALLLDAGICVLRRHGLRALLNEPVNDRLRQYYAQMGFTNGTRLDLEDETALSLAFDFVERAYAKYGLVLVVEDA